MNNIKTIILILIFTTFGYFSGQLTGTVITDNLSSSKTHNEKILESKKNKHCPQSNKKRKNKLKLEQALLQV